MGHVGDGVGWWMLWGGLMMVLFWGAVIALVAWWFQALARRDTGHAEPHQISPSGRSPQDIAKERYARGDLARDEFEQINKDLENS